MAMILLWLLHAALFSFAWSSALEFGGVHWIEGTGNDSQVQTCARFGLQPADMNAIDLPWNQTTLEYVVHDVLNKSISSDANQYGIQGCCAPGLWCDAFGCFTQSYGQSFANYGILQSNYQYKPVYTCWNDTNQPVLNIAHATLNPSTSQLYLYGEGFGDSNAALNVPWDTYRCGNAGLCDCVSCSAAGGCPVGSSCFYSITNQASFCYKICAGAGDEACACGQICSNVQNTYGNAISLCMPRNASTVGLCSRSGGSELMCDASPAIWAAVNQSITVELSLTAGSAGDAVEMDIRTAIGCATNSSCFDGNPCTTDTCMDGTCVFVPTDCNSVLPTYREQYTPFTYNTLSFAGNATDYKQIYATMTAHSYQTISSTSSTSDIFLSFWMMLFGGIMQDVKIYGNGMLALPPFASCNTARCGLFSTATNLIAPWYSAAWTKARVWTYAQHAGDAERFFDIDANAFHVLMNLTTSTAYSTVLASLYQDGSVRFSYLYLSSPAAAEFVGLWGSTASDTEEIANYLRYGKEDISEDPIEGQSIAFCYMNTTACVPESCVNADEVMEINWNSSTTCNAISGANLTHKCVWYGGVNESDAVVTVATAAQHSTGVVSCRVPWLNITDGSLVNVDLVTIYPDGVTGRTLQGQKAVYGIGIGSNGELARSNLMVRYHASASPVCGCSALRIGGQCDNMSVCFGENTEGDCMATPFGSAYHDACSTCTGGLTHRVPHFTCPFVPSGFINIVTQTIILLIIICCMTIITSAVSYSIRRMLVRRAHQDAIMVEAEFARQVFQADGGGLMRPNRRGLTDFECEAIGQVAFTKAFWMQHRNVERTAEAAAAVDGETADSEGKGQSGVEMVAAPVSRPSHGETCDCSICLMEITEGNMVRVLPEPCGHVFHVDCIDEWFKQSSVCPLCKRSMRSILSGEEDVPSSNSRGYQALDGHRYYNTNLRENAAVALFGYRYDEEPPRPRVTMTVRPVERPRVAPQMATAEQATSTGNVNVSLAITDANGNGRVYSI